MSLIDNFDSQEAGEVDKDNHDRREIGVNDLLKRMLKELKEIKEHLRIITGERL